MHHWHSAPSRFVWFMIGAFSATWWLKHKHHYHSRVSCSRPDLPADSYSVPPSFSQYYPPASTQTANNNTAQAVPAATAAVEVQTQAQPDPQSRPPSQPRPEKAREWGWGWRSHSQGHESAPPPPSNPPVDHRWDDEDAQKRWIEERQQRMQGGRQASDTFAEFSEATLDSVLSAVESMKSKLAEHRANRERQVRDWQAFREEQIRQLEEWKKQQQQQQATPPFRPSSV